MTKRARYSAEEARRIIMSMPDDSDSDDPNFSGGDGDADDGIDSDSSDSDSNAPEINQSPETTPVHSSRVRYASGRGLGRRPRRGRGLLRDRSMRGSHVQGRIQTPSNTLRPQQTQNNNHDQRWGDLDHHSILNLSIQPSVESMVHPYR